MPVLVGCNIPLNKLNDVRMREFMEKYTGCRLPSENIIRKNYTESLYLETIENIRREIGDDPILASVDETTDVQGRYIINIIVGPLREECDSRSCLINSTHLEHTNAQKICKTLNEAFEILWPGGIKYSRVWLLITDAAAYMKKAGKDLWKVLYTKMVHITCFAHALHNLANFVCGVYSNSDGLVSSVKKKFF